MENSLIGAPALLFIGMPASGKTTVGGLAARLLGLPFADFDEIICARTAMTVPELFSKKGEKYFRRLERELAIEYSNRGAMVLSPGGGLIENRYAMDMLMQKSVVCRLIRAPRPEAMAGRPLLAAPGAYEALLARREPLYKRYASFTLENESTPRACALEAVRGYLERIK